MNKRLLCRTWTRLPLKGVHGEGRGDRVYFITISMICEMMQTDPQNKQRAP